MSHPRLIRGAAVLIAAACCLATARAAAPEQTIAPVAARLLDAARLAIGIPPKTQGPAALRMTGTEWTSQVVSTDGRTGITRVTEREYPIEVLVAFPDRYRMVGSLFSARFRHGFNDETYFRLNEAADASETRRSPEWTARLRLDLTRFAVGMLARTDTLAGLTVSDAGPNAVRLEDASASAPQPQVMTLEFDPATRLPARLVWRMRTVVHVPGSERRSGGGAGAGPVGAETPEETLTMSFTDRRDVSGLKLPFRVSVAAKGITLREFRFDRIEVNPALTDEDFQ